MTLQLQQQWRKDGEKTDESPAHETPATPTSAPHSEPHRNDANH